MVVLALGVSFEDNVFVVSFQARIRLGGIHLCGRCTNKRQSQGKQGCGSEDHGGDASPSFEISGRIQNIVSIDDREQCLER